MFYIVTILILTINSNRIEYSVKIRKKHIAEKSTRIVYKVVTYQTAGTRVQIKREELPYPAFSFSETLILVAYDGSLENSVT